MFERVHGKLQRALADPRLLSLSSLTDLVGYGVGDARLALCLHRVGWPEAPGNMRSDMNIASDKLDALLESLVASCGSSSALTITFDDGYADAAEYIRTRRDKFPEVEFIFFVCPDKLVSRRAFRWDLGTRGPEAKAFGPPFDREAEAKRPDLAGLADRAQSRLVTVEECLELRSRYRVTLGDHTNVHLPLNTLTLNAARQEIEASARDFQALFGKTAHFAFPFGTVLEHFDARHAQLVFESGYEYAWSTEARPYRAAERRPGAVLPRLPIFGTQSLRSLLAYVALRALRSRFGGRPKLPNPVRAPDPAFTTGQRA